MIKLDLIDPTHPLSEQDSYGRVKDILGQTLKGLGTDVATIGGNAGYRTTVAALGTAKSAEEMGVIARLSSRFGTATRAVMVLGGGALTFASFATTAAMWSLWLMLWIAGFAFGAARLGRRIGRWIWPRPAMRLQAA